MEWKKKLKAFFTLTRRAEEGFTLVELIVVIAILAILAGVGSAGYAGYIKAANKGNDKTLVGNIIRALETSANSGLNSFELEGQYSEGIQIPVGFVVISNEILTSNGQSGYTLAISNDSTRNPIHTALLDALGSDYANTTKLTYDGWEVSTVSGSNFHNASAGMMQKIDDVGETMIAVNNLGITMTKDTYEDTDEMLISIANSIADYDGDGIIETEDKTMFINTWAAAYDQPCSSIGFGLSRREDYSAVRMAYNSAFAEYVRANYNGTQDADTLANLIANYGQTPGELVAEKIKETSPYKVAWEAAYKLAYYNFKADTFKNDAKSKAKADSDCEYLITEAVDAVANSETNFPYAATSKAFEDSEYAGYGDTACQELYNEWIKGQDEVDAAVFYDTMLTVAVEGQSYDSEKTGKSFTEWFAAQATAYSENLSSIETLVKDKCAVVIVVYSKYGILSFDVYDPEANPRND